MRSLIALLGILLFSLRALSSQVGYVFKEDIWVDPPGQEQHSFAWHLSMLPVDQERLYEDMLVLKTQKLSLRQRDENLWSKDGLNVTIAAGQAVHDLLIDTGQLRALKRCASYEFDARTMRDYVFDVRQWFKHYKQDSLNTLTYGPYILVTNGQMLYSLDTRKNQILWRIGDVSGRDHDRYVVSAPPHQNSDDYGWSIYKDQLIVSMDGVLAVVDISHIDIPALVWKKSIAGYSAATTPIVVGDKIVVGLVNSRMEFWLTGWDHKDGGLAWARRVCLTSHLSPASRLYFVSGERFTFVTNHGFAISGNSRTGKVEWLRKYESRKYTLFDYWTEKDKLGDSAATGDEGQVSAVGDYLVMKPRESSHVYLIGQRNGALIKDIALDGEKDQFVGLYDDWMILLRPSDKAEGKKAILAKNIFSEKQLKEVALDVGGRLSGVYQKDSKIYFKIAGLIYEVDFKTEGGAVNGKMARYSSDSGSWLKCVSNEQFILAHDTDLETYSLNQAADGMSQKAGTAKRIELFGAAHASMASGFGKGLEGVYKNGFKYQVLAVENRSNQKPLDLLLLIRGDQLLGVDPSGVVLWARDIQRSYTLFDMNKYVEIKVKVWNDILLVNDATNILAISPHGGKLLWSIFKRGNDRDHIGVYEVGEGIIVVADNRLILMDGKQGSIIKETLAPHNFRHAGVAGDRLYTTNWENDELELWSANLVRSAQTIKLSQYDSCGKVKLSLLGKYYLLETCRGIYVLDGEDLSAKGKLSLEKNGFNVKRYAVRKINDRQIILYYPGRCLEEYELQAGGELGRLWTYDMTTAAKWWSACEVMCQDENIPINIVDGSIVVNTTVNDQHAIVAINQDSGKVKWSTKLDFPQSLFMQLSNIIRNDRGLAFVFSAKLGQSGAGYSEIESRYYEVGKDDGKVLKQDAIASIAYRGYAKIDLVNVKDDVCFAADGYLLNCRRMGDHR